MNILIVGGSFSLINGYTRAVESIAQTLSKNNNVFLLPLFPTLFNANSRNVSFKFIDKKISSGVIWKMAKNTKKYSKLINEYCNPFLFSGMLYLVGGVFHKSVIEITLNKIKPDIVHIHGLTLDIWPFIELLIEKNIPFCVTLHAIGFHDSNVIVKYNKKFEVDAIDKLISEKVPISVVSEGIKSLITKEFDFSQDYVRVILNGVNLERFIPNNYPNKLLVRSKLNIPQEKKILLQVGSLSKRKNQIAVLDCISKMSNDLREKIHYVIVGDGDEKDNLLNFCKNEEISKFCTFTGQLSDYELDSLYLASDFFILPSTSEGLALVSLEAMGAGLPIITFASLEGIKEICSYNVQLIPERNSEAMASSIKLAIEYQWDNEKIREYAKKWSWEKVCLEYLELYEQTIYFKQISNK